MYFCKLRGVLYKHFSGLIYKLLNIISMKRTLLFLAIMLLGVAAEAKPVDVNTAHSVAEAYLSAKGMKNSTALVNITATTSYTEFYIFAAPEGGFILISGDDCTTPVLGYSVDNTFSASNIPANLREVLDGFERIIRAAKRNGEPSLTEEWKIENMGNGWKSSVGPLLTTTWDQHPYYNEMCPYDSAAGARSITGCVATATAQVMKFHNHPVTGYGSHTNTCNPDYGPLTVDFGATTYDWAHMPNVLTAASSETEANAVATLIYHVGVASDMEYSPNLSSTVNYSMSGTLQKSAQRALLDHFKYRPDMAVVLRDKYSNDEYCARLRAELDQSRPILYSGSDGHMGHSFVCDGYNNDGLFHINWGWSGLADGYFVMGNLVPSANGAGANSGTYNLQNAAIIGIRPNTDWAIGSTTTVTASINSPATLTGAGSYAFGDTVTLDVVVPEGYRFKYWSDGNSIPDRQFIAQGGSYNFTAEVEPLSGDTLSYCGLYAITMSNISLPSPQTSWGIRLPASVLTDGRYLEAAQLFVAEEGNYTLAVIAGTDAPTDTLFTATHHFGENDINRWNTVPVTSLLPVDTTRNLWITFTCPDADNPFTFTLSCGNNDECVLSDEEGSTIEDYEGLAVLIRGIFGDGSTANCAIHELPWEENFEEGVNCWQLSGFALESGATSHSGSHCLAANGSNDGSWAITPAILLPADSTNSALSYYVNAPAGSAYEVRISVGGNTPDDFSTVIYAESDAGNAWQQRAISLAPYVGQPVYVAFRCLTPAGGSQLLIDDIRVGANDTALVYHIINAVSSNPAWGTVTGAGLYVEGETVVLQAVPATGYQFAYWNGGGLSDMLSFPAIANMDLVANFITQRPIRSGDTISYCGNDPKLTKIGNAYADFHFGMMLPASSLAGSDYLLSVMLYSLMASDYTLNIYRGGDTVPAALVHSQPVSITTNQEGWQEIVLTDSVSLDNENLWVTFLIPAVGNEMAVSGFAGIPGGLISFDGNRWSSMASKGFLNVFMIKAITGTYSTGIGEVEREKLTVEIYPNPTAGDVSISVSQPSTVTIVDIAGREVIPATTFNTHSTLHMTLPSGIYFVHVMDHNNATVQKLIVK